MLGSMYIAPPLPRVRDPSSFSGVYVTKSPCSKKVPLPPEHLKLHSYMINVQHIQCVHFFLQSYLANAGPFCYTKTELFAAM